MIFSPVSNFGDQSLVSYFMYYLGILFLFFFLKKVFSGGSMPQLYEDHSTKQVERSAMEVSPLLSMNGPRGKSYSHQAIVLHNPAESVIQTKIEW